MIKFQNVSKKYAIRSGYNQVLNSINFEVGLGEKVGIIGRNGAGKSTTIRLLSGAELPTGGQIDREMSVSWPLAFGGAFQSTLTGRDNLRLICRIYGRQAENCVDFVQSFAELGTYFDEPVKTYSSGMRARLAFAISMIIEFECFLIDEVVAVGDSRFHEKCHRELFERRADRAFVIVSHDTEYVRAHCDRVMVLRGGSMMHFASPDEAIEFHLHGDDL
jgi:capsular polysaccharide transport system ATP-binding protein